MLFLDQIFLKLCPFDSYALAHWPDAPPPPINVKQDFFRSWGVVEWAVWEGRGGGGFCSAGFDVILHIAVL